jgi:hypothetical protein
MSRLPDFRALKTDLEPDGSLRDIYVLDTTSADWERVYNYLVSRYPCVFSLDNRETPAPGTVRGVFELARSARPVLTCSAGPLRLNCHFFTESQIELDFHPQDISGQSELEALFVVVEQLGDLTEKTVLVTPENSVDLAFLRWDPKERRLRYVPPPLAV